MDRFFKFVFSAPLPERAFFQVALGLVGITFISFVAMEMDD